MTDRELLEAAARAAGYEVFSFTADHVMVSANPNHRGFFAWNPLTDDGDRYRLLKTLKIAIDFEIFEVIYLVDGNICAQSFREDGDDARAVLRAAAEIGRAMK